MKRYIVISVMSFFGLAAMAQTWTLDSCISYAISHNITVKTRQLDTYSAELNVTEAKDAFLPTAEAQANQTFNFGRGLSGDNTYSNRNTSQFGWNIGVSVPLFQGLSAVRRLDYSKANLAAIAEQCEAAKDNVELQVITQYLQVLYCGEVLDVAREQKRLSEVQLSRSRILCEEGKIPELDVVQAEAQVSQNQLQVVNAENDRVLALLDLSQLLQLPSFEGFDIAPLDDEKNVIPAAAEVYTSALQSNHAIRAGRLAIEAADKNIRLAKTGYYPRLSFNIGVGSSYYNVSGMENAPFHRQMRDNFNTGLGFTLSVPIFDAFSTRNSIRRAEVSRNTALLQLEDSQSNLYKAINQAYQQAIASEHRLEAAQVAEKATKAAMEAMNTKYDFGRANATELEQARSEYIQARLQTVQATFETLLRRRILEFYNRPI